MSDVNFVVAVDLAFFIYLLRIALLFYIQLDCCCLCWCGICCMLFFSFFLILRVLCSTRVLGTVFCLLLVLIVGLIGV